MFVMIKLNNVIYMFVLVFCFNVGGKIILFVLKNSVNNIKFIVNIFENFKDDFIFINFLK